MPCRALNLLYLAMSLANDQVSMSGSDDTSSDTYKHSNGSEVFEKGEKCNFVDEELDEMLEEEKQLSQQALDEYKAAQERAGVIYISRIPPGMNPNKVRHLMGAYGEIGRVYLQQEGRFTFFSLHAHLSPDCYPFRSKARLFAEKVYNHQEASIYRGMD